MTLIIIFIVSMMMISQGCPMLTQDVVSAQYFAYRLAFSYYYHHVHLIHHHVHHHVSFHHYPLIYLNPYLHHHISSWWELFKWQNGTICTSYVHSLSYIWGMNNMVTWITRALNRWMHWISLALNGMFEGLGLVGYDIVWLVLYVFGWLGTIGYCMCLEDLVQ